MYTPFLFNTTESDIPYVLFYDNGNQVVPNHWHKELEFSFSTKGDTRILVNEQLYEIPEGEAILINGGDSHFYFSTKNHDRIVIILDLSIVDGSSNQIELKKTLSESFNQNEKTTFNWSYSEKKRLKEIIHNLEELNLDTSANRVLAIRAYVFELLYLFSISGRKKKQTLSSKDTAHNRAMNKLSSIFLYVEGHYTEPITLTDVAGYVGFDPSYFSRFFKSYTHTTFNEYLTSYRVSKAQYALVSQMEKSVGQIAEEVGFTSIKTFNRVFKKYANNSPVKFRKVNI